MSFNGSKIHYELLHLYQHLSTDEIFRIVFFGLRLRDYALHDISLGLKTTENL